LNRSRVTCPLLPRSRLRRRLCVVEFVREEPEIVSGELDIGWHHLVPHCRVAVHVVRNLLGPVGLPHFVLRDLRESVGRQIVATWPDPAQESTDWAQFKGGVTQ
jgi:hypothetical protein